MRLFVALDLTPEVRAALDELLAQLAQVKADVRWVRPEGMHLTLKFIGEVPDQERPAIQDALGRVTSTAPIAMSFEGLGYFPNERRPRVLWVGIRASDNLAPLAAQVEAALEPLGIQREKRTYVPHLTLGRFRSANGLAGLQAAVAALPTTQFGQFEGSEFFLYQSKLSPRGAEYSKLAQYAFVRS